MLRLEVLTGVDSLCLKKKKKKKNNSLASRPVFSAFTFWSGFHTLNPEGSECVCVVAIGVHIYGSNCTKCGVGGL